MKTTGAGVRTIQVVSALGRVTYREILRDKILYNILLCGILLFGIALLASRLMIRQEDRVVLDFGLTAVNLSCSLLAMLVGGAILSREIDRRTILVSLARPITRHQFVLGKFFGLALVLALNWALLSGTFAGVLYAVTEDPSRVFTQALTWGLALQYFQALLIGAVAFAISAASTTSLAVILSIGLYLIGNNISELRQVADKFHDSAFGSFLSSVSYVFPNLEHFVLGTSVTYGLPVSWQFGLGGIVYAMIWLALAWGAAGRFLAIREL